MRPMPLSKSNQEVGMCGDESIPDGMFSYVRPEQRVPADHPSGRWWTRCCEPSRPVSRGYTRRPGGRPSPERRGLDSLHLGA
jgi:hypothetical protein